MSTINSVLADLGLNKLQIALYQAFLENKNVKIKDLLIQHALHRVGLYSELQTLFQNGFLTKNPKWQAVSPNLLLQKLEIANASRLKNQKTFAKEIQDWEFLWNTNKFKSDIQLFTGDQQFKVLYEQIQKEMENELLTFGDIEIIFRIFGSEYAQSWIDRRKQKGIFVKALLPKTFFTEQIQQQDAKFNRQTKFINLQDKPNSVFSIYSPNKMFVYEPQKRQLININNPDIVQMFRQLFYLAWESV